MAGTASPDAQTQLQIAHVLFNMIARGEPLTQQQHQELFEFLNIPLRPRTPQEITDAEIVAAANEMLTPQSCIDPNDGTFPKYHELDEIAQMELGYQVAVAISAAEKARLNAQRPIPKDSSTPSG